MQQIIEGFYKAFSRLDAEGMAQFYHREVVFEDPAFGQLKGERAANMWRMLCESQKDKPFTVTFSEVWAEGDRGGASWEAVYTFGKQKRRVHNRIKARFWFRDGQIIRHEDRFPLSRWAAQALGWQGWLLGWTPFFRQKMQAQSNKMLDRFEAKRKEGGG